MFSFFFFTILVNLHYPDAKQTHEKYYFTINKKSFQKKFDGQHTIILYFKILEFLDKYYLENFLGGSDYKESTFNVEDLSCQLLGE